MTREEVQNLMVSNYELADYVYVKKLGSGEEEFLRIIKAQPIPHNHYASNAWYLDMKKIPCILKKAC